MIKTLRISLCLLALFTFTGCQGHADEIGEANETFDSINNGADHIHDGSNESTNRPACTLNLSTPRSKPTIFGMRCKQASPRQIAEVNNGNLKRDQFLSQCYTNTENSCWCDHLLRPNPNSISIFYCTYGEDQTHQLIHPDETTWKYAFEAVKIVEELEEKRILTQIIYNWWRPEPYNKNVGGSAIRHPFGTSVDVRFETKEMQEAAFLELCKMREEGRIRAIGYYGGRALHFGIGDDRANTWGKSCPKT